MSALMELVRAGRTVEVVGLLDGMTDAERRSCFPELKALRKELRAAPWEADARRAYPALHAAGAACQTGAAGVAAWIAAADLRWSRVSPGVLLHVLGDRETDWLADVTHRLARRPVTASVPYELMAGLVRLSGCPVPTTDAYVRGWVDHLHGSWQRGGTLLDRLRQDPHLRELVAALFETDDIGSRLQWPTQEGPDSWTGALAQLTVEGALDRGATVDACVARLLRGGPAADQRVFLRLLKCLALTPDEERQRTADWLALASDAASTVASHAQSVLGALALDGGLAPRQVAEMSEAVLFRTERKLVRAQLVLLGKVLTRDASTAGELLPAVARAFGHEDAEVQERALKLAERHVRKLDSVQARTDLALAAEQLIPLLRARAVGALGAAPADPEPTGHEELLPPPPRPARLAPAAASAVELAEEVGAALAAEPGVTGFERALDGLVRHAYRDREALLSALEPVVARRWWDSAAGVVSDDRFGGSYGAVSEAADGLDLVLATLRGKVRTATLHARVQRGSASRDCVHGALFRAFECRLWEVAYRMRTDPLPLLLSTPTWSTGLLEPAELVDRLDTYRRLGARVAATDFAQALLRVRRADRDAAESAARRAAALGTAEGTRLAAWLASGPPALPTFRRRTSGRRVLVELGEVLDLQHDFPAEFRPLGRPTSVFEERRWCYHWDDDMRQHWSALLPERRELVAARLLRDLSDLAVDDFRGAAAALPSLAESGGEAGEAVHLGVAYGLGARHAEDRLAAVDALLVLAARGHLDAARLGADLGQLVRRGAVKTQRLADAARTAAVTGANATIWSVLSRTLPILLADLATGGTAAPARGLGELLAVAAECAERSGARGELPHLAQAAARRGSSRLATQARRLRSALGEEVAA
ncbi:DUF7824 domain-containing protein [Streptomyces chromofuscus]|uniref:Secreted protein n=1 Tax=Streptomyces chromofuscus TaxID=42881 RepID=A0A7M2TA44_STRCW|nr:DUF6493 family protein [Streptomyces chromofuscus]QOV45412.1 hypothetical protein IPT68_05535 [Streptomyces chromofuscus]GGS97764.1 hypothetical protein GCM10010254_17080 [Streptomyces chromofuscus]